MNETVPPAEVSPLTTRTLVFCSLFVLILSPAFAAEKRIPADGWLKGSTIRHPEKLAGLWEADVHHRIFGLQIVLTTRARKAPNGREGLIQICEQATIEVFEQMGSMRAEGEGNWFETDSPGVAWKGNHLKIGPATPSDPDINVDLAFDAETETWSGTFHRNGLDEKATLHRPHPAGGNPKSPFAGTWKHAGVANTCMHIVEGAGGELHAWSDDVLAPGALKYANGIAAARETVETYGFTAQVELHSAHNIFVRLKTLSPVCCAIDAGGVLSQDGTRIRSNVQSENNRNPGSDDWVRVKGDSCLTDAP